MAPTKSSRRDDSGPALIMDCHVHLNEITIRDQERAKRLGIRPGETVHKCASLEDYARHITKDGLDTILAIYDDDPENVLALREKVPDCDVKGAFWPRAPSDPSLEEKCDRLHGKNLLQALKVHPVLDNFDLTTENIENVLSIARKYGIPILYHSDDRADGMELTSPARQKKLIEENGDVTFIIGHGGAYAHHRLVGNSPAARGYWDGSSNALYSRRELVEAALELADKNENVYYDVSICTNRVKAKMIADFVNEHPSAAGKILIGTDFPIMRSSARSQVNALKKAGLKQAYLEKIISNRL